MIRSLWLMAPAPRLTKPEPVEEEAEDRLTKCAPPEVPPPGVEHCLLVAVVRAGTGPGPSNLTSNGRLA